MFYFFLALSLIASALFVKSYYPDFKGSTDLFSILGFILICGIGSVFFYDYNFHTLLFACRIIS